MSELLRCLGALVESATRMPREIADELGLGSQPEPSEHTDLFVLSLAPYASIYLGAEGMLGGEARDRVAGFWRALALEPPKEPDHLTTLLAFYASLAERETESAECRLELADTGYRTARSALLWEHLVSWLPVYLERLHEAAGPFYRRWSELLVAAIAEECAGLPAPQRLALHLREAPTVPDPRTAGAEPFLRGLLTPVASGAIVLRDDLARSARRSGASVRIGDRLFVLRNLWAQEPAALAASLAGLFDTAAECHRGRDTRFGPVNEFWRRRAVRTAALLRALEVDCDAAEAG